MLKPVTAIQFHRPMGVGKTAPSLVTCVHDDGKREELVVKFAGGCEAGIGSLLREAIAALMAADLDLPARTIFSERRGGFCRNHSRGRRALPSGEKQCFCEHRLELWLKETSTRVFYDSEGAAHARLVTRVLCAGARLAAYRKRFPVWMATHSRV
jgi:hypothetical protein